MHPAQMSAADTALVVIDVQEKLMAKIPGADLLTRNIGMLVDAARLLGLPVLATEQYPKGLGPTVAALAARLPDRPEKLDFSCCAIPAVVDTLRRQARPKVLLSGIEAHVCVLQTALDLQAQDFRVYVAADAIASRFSIDRQYALRRLERAGAILTTAETAVFEWVGGARHPQFKAISKLIQERMKNASASNIDAEHEEMLEEKSVVIRELARRVQELEGRLADTQYLTKPETSEGHEPAGGGPSHR
jgi:nicotinamidase-related amidase